MSLVKLISVPKMDMQYNHTVDFASISNQTTWFSSKAIYERNITNIAEHAFHTEIDVPLEYHRVKECNYLMLVGAKIYYYFITDSKIKTKKATTVYVKLDVMQTYLFSHTLDESFVVRGHVNRWNGNTPTRNLEDEPVGGGEMLLKTVDEICLHKNQYLISSSSPLGMSEYDKTGTGGGGGSEDCGDWTNGIPSTNGFRFMKGYEGFGAREYQDSGGYWTIAYGITKHGEPDIYYDLASRQPVKEEESAKISYNLKIERYGKPIVNAVMKMGCNSQQQFDALIDLAFNAGTGVITGSNSLTEAIKRNPLDEGYIRPIWEKFYTSSSGIPLPGLVLRRKAEADIFFGKGYEMRPIALINSSGNISGTMTENNGDGWLPSCDTSEPSKGEVENKFGKGAKPTSGTCSAGYPSYPSGAKHTGIDIANAEGTPIYAWRSGTVKAIGAGYGNSITIEHDDNKSMAIYGHCKDGGVLVKQGDKVTQGQKIGLMGSTGNSTGNHLHFEVRPKGGAYGTDVDPWFGLKYGDKV